MIVYRNIEEVQPIANAVVTIGTFDGVHRGHQRILKKLNALAVKSEGKSVLITFHPHPRMVIRPEARVEMLSTLEEKLNLLEQYGVDIVVVVPFNRAFSDQTAQSYIQHFLLETFNPHTLVIGYDHRFGKDRTGDINMLRDIASTASVEVIEIEKKEVEEAAVSSTRIRKALHDGDVKLAKELAGHAYELSGIVVKGEQIGRQLGFPTANIRVEDSTKLIPGVAVYAVIVKVRDDQYKGMLSIGYRPTFDGKSQSIEVHLFDFSGDIYGETVTLRFVDFIRGELKFESREALVSQLEKDKIAALSLLS